MKSLADADAFIRANTRPIPVPDLGITLWQADELTPIWKATEANLRENNIEPPFWAFAWAGGQALSRYILDHPEIVAGKRVLDLACGSGLVAIAAAKAGAARVEGNDIDPMCQAATLANAALNDVEIVWRGDDLLDQTMTDVDVLLAGDVFYEQVMARRFLAFLRRSHDSGASVFVGDPGRTYFPRDSLIPCAEYQVQTTTEIENDPVRAARVWRF